MIKAEIIGVGSVVSNLRALSPRAELELIRSVGRLCLDIERKVKQEKLTGQVLHVRTGRLRRSIHSEVSSSDTTVTGIVGTNVEYAAAHEYGFSGTESVRAHLRTITQAFGKTLKGGPLSVQVSAHSRQVHLPERSFLRSALRETRTETLEAIKAALRKATGE